MFNIKYCLIGVRDINEHRDPLLEEIRDACLGKARELLRDKSASAKAISGAVKDYIDSAKTMTDIINLISFKASLSNYTINNPFYVPASSTGDPV